MKADLRRLITAFAPGIGLAVWLIAGILLLGATLPAEVRTGLIALLAPLTESHGALVVGWVLLGAAIGAMTAWRLYESHVAAPARLADAIRVLAGDPHAPQAVPEGSATTRSVARAVNTLASARRSLVTEMEAQIAEASRAVARQRDQLAALMAELDQAILVLNPDGRILLYNARARSLVQRLFGTGTAAAERIGLGRSVHGIIDPALMAHAREMMARPGETGAATFVTHTPAGHLMEVRIAPVRPVERSGAPLSGYVLLLDDITDAHDAEARRDRSLRTLSEATRSSLASLQAALDLLDLPDLDADDRRRFETIVRDEVAGLGQRLATLSAEEPEDARPRWPLMDMRGQDLAEAAARRIAADTGLTVAPPAETDILWLQVDSFALLTALSFLATRLAAAGTHPALSLALKAAGNGRAHLDLIWCTADVATGPLSGWQTDAVCGGPACPDSVREVAERHGGEVWLEHDRLTGRSFFRFLLPLATGARDHRPAMTENRPEYYDFDLFAAGTDSHDADGRPLSDLAYTVFDTETTGLDPAGGDEILQIGAVRIVNGRLLSGEYFDQLVDPGRPIPEAGIAIHGIRPEMVRGQPPITAVLPAFRGFVADTVLVGHNVAFDLRFLKLKEAATGVRFDMAVLDTLLLASIIWPNERSHGLADLAARFGLTIHGRHTGLGDAQVTAEILLKLVPLLKERGIRTLGEARAAAQDSYYARLKY
ncbi:exonuclease domain-containing protein [Segnochrobactraceae bacterium EtOH-i3]